MHRNYCFRRKRHSYTACDAALVASTKYISISCVISTKCDHRISILHAGAVLTGAASLAGGELWRRRGGV